MTIDRKSWDARLGLENSARDAERRAAAALQRLRQAAVPLERLTGHEAWDTFLRLGEQKQETDRSELAAVRERLAGLGFLSEAELARLRWQAAILQAAIVARQEILDLPRAILQSLQQVSELNQTQ